MPKQGVFAKRMEVVKQKAADFRNSSQITKSFDTKIGGNSLIDQFMEKVAASNFSLEKLKEKMERLYNAPG